MQIGRLMLVCFLFTVTARAEHDHDVPPGRAKPRYESSGAGAAKPLHPETLSEPKPAAKPGDVPATAKPYKPVLPGEDKVAGPSAKAQETPVPQEPKPKLQPSGLTGKWSTKCIVIVEKVRVEGGRTIEVERYSRRFLTAGGGAMTEVTVTYRDEKCDPQTAKKVSEHFWTFSESALAKPEPPYTHRISYGTFNGEPFEGLEDRFGIKDGKLLFGDYKDAYYRD